MQKAEEPGSQIQATRHTVWIGKSQTGHPRDSIRSKRCQLDSIKITVPGLNLEPDYPFHGAIDINSISIQQ